MEKGIAAFSLRVCSPQDSFTTFGRFTPWTIGWVLATAQAVSLIVRLCDLHKGLVPFAGGSLWGLDIVLSTTIMGIKAVLGSVDLTGHLDPLFSIVAADVGRLYKPFREGLGFQRGLQGLGGAEGNCRVFTFGNLFQKSKKNECWVKTGVSRASIDQQSQERKNGWFVFTYISTTVFWEKQTKRTLRIHCSCLARLISQGRS